MVRTEREESEICPAYAGVIPIQKGGTKAVAYLSCVCGGDP